MNTSTANKLNQLLSASHAVETKEDNGYLRFYGPNAVKVRDACFEIISKHMEEAIRQEIVNAARDRRSASVSGVSKNDYYVAVSFSEDTASEIAVRLAQPEVDAYIQAVNRATSDAYEIYRAACEQGVAVPPA